MRNNKLQSLKQLLRKISASCLIIGLLISSYGIYLASPASRVYADFFIPACTTDGTATGTRLEKAEFAGVNFVDNRNTVLRVRNCSTTQDFYVTAEKSIAKCDSITLTRCAENITTTTETIKVAKDNLPDGGSYAFFNAEAAMPTCGSVQTHITLKSYKNADNSISGTYPANYSGGKYSEAAAGACKPAVTATPVPTATQVNLNTYIIGRVVEGNTFWQNEEAKCGTSFPSSAGLSVGPYKVNSCNPQPHYTSGLTQAGNKTLTVGGVPAGYTCTLWTHQIVNKITNAAETVATGNSCTISANFNTLDTNKYDGTHYLTFHIAKQATASPTPFITTSPSPQTTASPVIQTATPTPTTASVVTPTPVPPTAQPTITSSPVATIVPATTHLKLCTYEDDNADGIHNNGENTLSWGYTYTTNGSSQTTQSNWWNPLTQGCAIVTVPTNTSITVNNTAKPGWRTTAIYADGARTDSASSSSYTYTSNVDAVKVLWFLTTFTPTTVPATVPPTSQPSSTAIPTSSPTPSPSVTSSPQPTATTTASPSPTATSPTLTAPLRICKYHDENSDGILQTGENKKSWTFRYTVAGEGTRTVESHWYNVLDSGCADVNVSAGHQVTVEEITQPNWTFSALYADAAKVDGSSYTYTSAQNVRKEVWFLNKNTPGTTISPTPSPTPTLIPTSNTNYNVTLEKRVERSWIEGNNVKIEYNIKVKNNSGSDNFNNFQVRDILPEKFTYDSGSVSGDITTTPDIQDVSGDDNRRLVWNIGTVEKAKEINFKYRVTGIKENRTFCNDAQIRKDDRTVATSQACAWVNSSGQTAVLGVSTDRSLPETGSTPALMIGFLMLTLAAGGWKLSRHIE